MRLKGFVFFVITQALIKVSTDRDALVHLSESRSQEIDLLSVKNADLLAENEELARKLQDLSRARSDLEIELKETKEVRFKVMKQTLVKVSADRDDKAAKLETLTIDHQDLSLIREKLEADLRVAKEV